MSCILFFDTNSVDIEACCLANSQTGLVVHVVRPIKGGGGSQYGERGGGHVQ